MRTPVLSWKWTTARELAAQLAADGGQLTNDQIAAKAGVTASQFERWKHAPEFQARVAEHVEAFRKAISRTGLALKDNRIQAKKARAAGLRNVIRQRARAYAREPIFDKQGNPVLNPKTGNPVTYKVPGGDTGLLVRDPKPSGIYFAVDTGLLAALDTLETAIAIEMGDWKTKSQVEVAGQLSIVEILRSRLARRQEREANPPEAVVSAPA